MSLGLGRQHPFYFLVKAAHDLQVAACGEVDLRPKPHPIDLIITYQKG